MSEVTYMGGTDADGLVIVTLTNNDETRQVDIRLQKSLEIQNETVLAMAENAIEMLSVFMLLTKSEQRRFIENCSNIKNVSGRGSRAALSVVKS